MESRPLLEAGTKTALSQYHTKLTPTPFGMLFLIPPELREKIYRELVIAGSVRFLESSKAIHSEAIDVVSKEGVCRLEFNIFKPHNIFPVQDPTRPILNLEIRLNFIDVVPITPQEENSCTKVFNDWLSQFTVWADTPAHDVPRKSCKILLDCSPGFSEFRLLPAYTFDMIQYLTGFETLVFVFANNYKAETRQRMIERMYAPKPDPRRDIASAMHGREDGATCRMYFNVSEILEATLGPVYFVWDRKGMCLKFYPQEKNAEKTEESRSGLHRRRSRVMQDFERIAQLSERYGMDY